MTAPGRLTVRSARSEDVSALADLSSQLGYPVDAGALERRLDHLQRDPDQEVWVACGPEGDVWGWIHAFLAHRLESELFAELGGLVVREEKRGLGVGRALVEQAETWAVVRKAATVRVRSRTEREDARAFYTRLGFATTKTQRVFSKPLRDPIQGR